MKTNITSNLSLEQLRVEFMRLSPTYELAEQVETKGIAGEALVDATFKFFDKNYQALKRRKYAPATPYRFDLPYLKTIRLELKKVRETYKEYGNINMPYAKWITSGSNAANLLSETNQLHVALLSKYVKDRSRTRQRTPSITSHSLAIGENPFLYPDSLYVQIPLYAPDKEIIKSIKQLLLEHRDKKVNKESTSPATFSGTRINLNALRKKLHLLHCKIYYPDEPPWQLALRAGISKRYEDLQKNNSARNRSFSESDIEILNVIASRALANAQYICENAVRGDFPSMQKVITPNYDWNNLKKRLLKAWPKFEL
jgi:hypothetical protein